MSKLVVPEEEYLYPGHLACTGCGPAITLRHLLKAIGGNMVLVVPASCWAVLAGLYPKTTFKIATYLTTFASAAAEASAIRHALDKEGKRDTHVVVWAGDGATYDIGFAAFSGAAERNENIIYVCNDNEAYMNTGNQRSSATPRGAWSTTTPEGDLKATPKKNITEIMRAHSVPYIATTAFGNYTMVKDFYRKIEKAVTIQGFRFVQALGPCVPGWRYTSEKTVDLARLAVESNYFPLLEIEHGVCRVTYLPKKYVPVSEFLKLQGRFSHMSEEDIAAIARDIDERWRHLINESQTS